MLMPFCACEIMLHSCHDDRSRTESWPTSAYLDALFLPLLRANIA